jgi:Asp-tRNA(Asn)/Glu-tRNA(Gln) amidotransferase A subunit family amidase
MKDLTTKKPKILQYIDDHRILYEKEDATPEELEAVHKRQNERQQTAGGEYNRVLELLKKIRESGPLSEEEKIELQRLIKTLTAQGINVEALEKKYVAEKPKSNGKYIMPTINLDSFDWNMWLRQHDKNYETLEEELARGKKAGILENELAQEYWRTQYENYINQGGILSYKKFMKQQLSQKVSKKINQIAEEKKQTEGVAALFGVPKTIKKLFNDKTNKKITKKI